VYEKNKNKEEAEMMMRRKKGHEKKQGTHLQEL
jgi:hypothetical protein